MKTHKHHIVPKHMGGTNNNSNIVELTIEEHAEAHRLLYEQHGNWQDKVAWLGLAGLIDNAEKWYLILSESKKGKNNPMYGKPAPNRGIKRPGIGGRKKGFKWSDEERSSQMLVRSTVEHKEKMKKIYADPIRNKNISEKQKGRPGIAKGKIWYNNGNKEMYSDKCPKGFKKGRLPKLLIAKRGMKWYNNGIVNKQFKDSDILKGFVCGRIIKK